MISALLLGVICLVVGFLCGGTGVGGIMLIPALTLLTDLDTHTAMATALASFFFTATQIGVMYARRGMVNTSLLLPMVCGGLVFAYVGALFKSMVSAPLLNTMLALLILLSAVSILRPARQGAYSFAEAPRRIRNAFLFAMGALAGLAAGLTGVGGPIVSTPLMIYFGFSPLCCVAVGQAYIVAAALSGTVGNLLYGRLDYGILLGITVMQMIGTVLGVRMACKISLPLLRRIVAWVCIAMGLLLLGEVAFEVR